MSRKLTTVDFSNPLYTIDNTFDDLELLLEKIKKI